MSTPKTNAARAAVAAPIKPQEIPSAGGRYVRLADGSIQPAPIQSAQPLANVTQLADEAVKPTHQE